ncbi:MAG TPA: AAA family ATPase [Candidatus Angelobacter sp.]|jgi:hypothetical protein|nr:AAA family ATPase [Candidatus Angelobacter sp.]
MNPFSDVGTIVTGKRFLGRQAEVGFLQARVINGSGFGSVAVVGMPRSGKSSLVHNALLSDHPKLLERRVLAVELDAGCCNDFTELFSASTQEISAAAVRCGLATPQLLQLSDSVKNATSDELFFAVRGFFRVITRLNWRPLVVIDEFDSARNLEYSFGVQRSLHFIRELASNPSYKVCFVLISKRELTEISTKAGYDGLYWANVLTTCPLAVFNDFEVREYFQFLAIQDIDLNEEQQNKIVELTGRLPFLLDAVAFHLCEGDIAFRNGLSETQLMKCLKNYYLSVFRSLTDVFSGERLHKLLQLIVGPRNDITPNDLDEFLRYGVIIESGSKVLPFCPALGEYLRYLGRQIEIWPLWSKSERSLRNALESKLIERFGDNWEAALGKHRTRFAELLKMCHDQMARELEKFGPSGSKRVLDYTYPQDLFEIMCADWDALGRSLLGGEKQEWAMKFNFLARIRNPIAHNRSDALPDYDKDLAEGYCKEILNKLELNLAT